MLFNKQIFDVVKSPSLEEDPDPLVSVILPFYNAEPYLKQAIQSIRHQTYTNLEIVLVDDGSTDNSYNIASQEAAIDKRIVLTKNTSNQGLIKSLNKAIDFVHGEYIARMDADDISYLDRIARQVAFMKNNPKIDLLGTGIFSINKHGKRIARQSKPSHNNKACKFTSFFATTLTHSTILAKANVFKKNKYLDSKTNFYIEDFELWNRLISSGYYVQNLKEPLLERRRHDGEVTHLNQPILRKNIIRCSRIFLKKYYGRNFSVFDVSVWVNKVADQPHFVKISKSFAKFDALGKEFIRRERLNKSDKMEVEKFIRHRKSSVIVSLLKRGNFIYKLKVLTFTFRANDALNIIGRLFFGVYKRIKVLF